jgi:hypothetical protein
MKAEIDFSEAPMQPGQPVSEAENRLKALFEEMDKNQLLFFDEAGKRIIELSTGLLGILFAVVAFGKDFPPQYLQDNLLLQVLVAGVLGFLVAALLGALITVQPRKYKHYEHNLTEMRNEWEKLFKVKSTWFRVASWLFFVGTGLLAVLIAVLVFSA